MVDSPIYMVMINRPGMPGTGITEAEKAQITSDLAALLGRVNITALSDVPDVDIGAAGDGDSLIYDESADAWIAGPVSGAIPLVRRSTGAVEITDVTTLETTDGIELVQDGSDPNKAIIQVAFYGSGSSTGVARSDHTHTNPVPTFQMFNATGYMSGGSRQVVSRNVTLASGTPYVVIARFRPQLRGADSGAAYYTLTTSIAGNSRTSPGGDTSGFWCVQGVPNKEEWVYSREIVGTGTSITVTGSVSYHSGAGFNVDAGELEIELKPSR